MRFEITNLLASNLLTQSFTGLLTDPIQIESITVSPDPPKPGENLTITVLATVYETIEVIQGCFLTLALFNRL